MTQTTLDQCGGESIAYVAEPMLTLHRSADYRCIVVVRDGKPIGALRWDEYGWLESGVKVASGATRLRFVAL